jgi:membrane dipeptidase
MGINNNKHPKVTAQSLVKGGVSLQILALWTGPEGSRADVPGIVRKELNAFTLLLQSGLTQIYDPKDAAEDSLSLMLSVEGGEVFEAGLHTVGEYAAHGVRMAAIIWNNENTLAKPAKSGSGEGLTAAGINTVREMQRLKMAVDVSHLNERGFYDILAKTNAPPLASHSCCRALHDHFRNLTDEQIRALITAGGYIGINFFPEFLTGGRADIDDVIHHIDHICQLGGAMNIGFGSDFDGISTTPEGLTTPADFPALLTSLGGRGYSQADIRNIAGENLLTYYARL